MIVKQAKAPRPACQGRQKIPVLHSCLKLPQSPSQRHSLQSPVPQPLCNAACTAGHRQQLPCPSWHTCLKLQHKQGKQWADSQTATLTPTSITTRRQHHLPHNRPAAPLFAENTARLNPRMSVPPVCLTSLPPSMFACWSHLPASPPCLIARLPAGLTCPPHLPASLHVCLPVSPASLTTLPPRMFACMRSLLWSQDLEKTSNQTENLPGISEGACNCYQM